MLAACWLCLYREPSSIPLRDFLEMLSPPPALLRHGCVVSSSGKVVTGLVKVVTGPGKFVTDSGIPEHGSSVGTPGP